MSEVRDYGLDGATPAQLNTSTSPLPPSHIDIEAQSPRSPIQSQEKGNEHPISPIVSDIYPVHFGVILHFELQDMSQK